MAKTDAEFTNNLTKNSYFTRRYDDLNFKSINVYGLEWNLYGLVYVGETKEMLNKRMCGRRSLTKMQTTFLTSIILQRLSVYKK